MGRLVRLPRSRVPRRRLLAPLTAMVAKPGDLTGSRGKRFDAPYVYGCDDETCAAEPQEFPSEPEEPKRLRCELCKGPMPARAVGLAGSDAAIAAITGFSMLAGALHELGLKTEIRG